MHADYPKREPTRLWDPVRVRYPVQKFPGTGTSSEAIGRLWRPPPEVLMSEKMPLEEIKDYMRDYEVTKDLTMSQSTKDFGYKPPETRRFNKHTTCTENHYIYPPSKRLAERVPMCSAHGASVMRSSYTAPTISSRLVTDKDQFKHPASLPREPPAVEPSWHKDIEPLDTTYDGFEKHLDPYLTTSRLHHRPFTADQLNKLSASKDVLTYYTFSKDPWIRAPKHKSEFWRLPVSRPKTTYDREKFKEDFREIRTHNKPFWVPGAFRTETRDKYRPESVRLSNYNNELEEAETSRYHRKVAGLATNSVSEHVAVKESYKTENDHIGTGRPICAVVNQFVEKNKRLEMRSMLNTSR